MLGKLVWKVIRYTIRCTLVTVLSETMFAVSWCKLGFSTI